MGPCVLAVESDVLLGVPLCNFDVAGQGPRSRELWDPGSLEDIEAGLAICRVVFVNFHNISIQVRWRCVPVCACETCENKMVSVLPRTEVPTQCLGTILLNPTRRSTAVSSFVCGVALRATVAPGACTP